MFWEQVDVEYDVQSDFAFSHDANSNVTESPGAYLLGSVEVLLQ